MTGPAPPKETRSLALRAAIGFAWVLVWRMATRMLGLGSSLILVRLLAPTDFGLVALALSVTQAVELLSWMGVEDAVIRHRNPEPVIYDTAFTLKALRAVLTAALIAGAAWPMSWFFAEPRVVFIVLALALSTLLSGLENIGIVDFRRNMTYDQEFKLRILPRLLSISSTITVAVLYRSYWALVIGMLVNRVAATALSYWFHPHRPRFTLQAWREITSFSLWTWSIAMVVVVRDRAETFIVGRLLGATELGLFTVAIEIAILPWSEIMQPLTSVLFAAFARAAHDDAETMRIFLRYLGLSALVLIPAGSGIALMADPLTHAVLGAKWAQVVPLIQVMGALSVLTPYGFISRALFESRGVLATSFGITLGVTVLRVALGIALVTWIGVVGALLAITGSFLVDEVLFLGITVRRFPVAAAQVIGRFWRPVLGTLSMGAVLIRLGLHIAPPNASNGALVSQMLLSALLGASVYVSVVLLAWLAVGRPDGPETDLLQQMRSAWRGAQRSFNRLLIRA
jgi:O-antigen/teichoic acid export membrane protein